MHRIAIVMTSLVLICFAHPAAACPFESDGPLAPESSSECGYIRAVAGAPPVSDRARLESFLAAAVWNPIEDPSGPKATLQPIKIHGADKKVVNRPGVRSVRISRIDNPSSETRVTIDGAGFALKTCGHAPKYACLYPRYGSLAAAPATTPWSSLSCADLRKRAADLEKREADLSRREAALAKQRQDELRRLQREHEQLRTKLK